MFWYLQKIESKVHCVCAYGIWRYALCAFLWKKIRSIIKHIDLSSSVFERFFFEFKTAVAWLKNKICVWFEWNIIKLFKHHSICSGGWRTSECEEIVLFKHINNSSQYETAHLLRLSDACINKQQFTLLYSETVYITANSDRL